MKMAWEENLKNDLQDEFDDSGIVNDNSSYPESFAGVRLNKSLLTIKI